MIPKEFKNEILDIIDKSTCRIKTVDEILLKICDMILENNLNYEEVHLLSFKLEHYLRVNDTLSVINKQLGGKHES